MKIKLLADVWSITDAMQLHCWQWQKDQQLLEQLGQGEHKQPGGNIIWSRDEAKSESKIWKLGENINASPESMSENTLYTVLIPWLEC